MRGDNPLGNVKPESEIVSSGFPFILALMQRMEDLVQLVRVDDGPSVLHRQDGFVCVAAYDRDTVTPLETYKTSGEKISRHEVKNPRRFRAEQIETFFTTGAETR